MRVLVTGAGGTLGLALAPALEQAGHEPVLQDVRDLDTPYEFVRGDVRSAQDVLKAARGADVIVHAAAIHGIYLGDHSTRDFYDLNLTGTLNVWEAAVEVGARAVVFSSTMGVYKTHNAPGGGSALRQNVPLQPGDIYGWTKLAGEELCRLYGRTHGIPSVALRFGMFVPESFFRYGIRLLYGGVDTSDVVRSVLTSIDALTTGELTWGAFNVESAVPFQEHDAAQLARDPLPVLDRYYPGASRLLQERGVEALAPITVTYPMDQAKQALGFEPQCNFEQWLDELRAAPTRGSTRVPPGRDRPPAARALGERRSRAVRSSSPCTSKAPCRPSVPPPEQLTACRQSCVDRTRRSAARSPSPHAARRRGGRVPRHADQGAPE